MTDHGSFVLFNVYVPASGGQPISYKMKFLQALRRAMQQQRQRKPVMLVGDLNVTSTALDIFWKDRVVHVQDILDQVASGSNGLPQWKQELAQSWPKIVATMETKEVVSTQTTNTLTREKFEKFRLCVNLDNRRVYLGKHESSPDSCLYHYDFSTARYVDPDTNEECVALEANVVSLDVLTELMAKIAGVVWDHPTQRLIARTDAGIRRVKPPRQWLQCVMEQDGMVDTFRHFYPTAEAR
jgi:exonuclease III